MCSTCVTHLDVLVVAQVQQAGDENDHRREVKPPDEPRDVVFIHHNRAVDQSHLRVKATGHLQPSAQFTSVPCLLTPAARTAAARQRTTISFNRSGQCVKLPAASRDVVHVEFAVATTPSATESPVQLECFTPSPSTGCGHVWLACAAPEIVQDSRPRHLPTASTCAVEDAQVDVVPMSRSLKSGSLNLCELEQQGPAVKDRPDGVLTCTDKHRHKHVS